MSTQSPWDEAQIHAYVDGALDAQAAARLAADSRGDALLAARVERQRRLRAQLRAAFDPVLDEPVPPRLQDVLAARPAAVVELDKVRAGRGAAAARRWSLREWGAIAATLVLGILLGSLLFRNAGDLPMATVQGRLVASGALDAALSTQPGGAKRGDLRIGLTFRVEDGSWCRTFSLRGSSGLACRRQDRWAVHLLEDGAPVDASDFRQASSALSPAMLGAIGALGAGDVLSPEQEQAQLRLGWQATVR